MKSFKEFYDYLLSNEKEKLLLIEGRKTIANEIETSICNLLVIKKDEREQFTSSLISYSESNELINEIDKRLPPPLPGESKEKFVERGLGIIRKIIREKFL